MFPRESVLSRGSESRSAHRPAVLERGKHGGILKSLFVSLPSLSLSLSLSLLLPDLFGLKQEVKPVNVGVTVP